MPNWKKVITSGSNAALNEITASVVSASSFVGASTVKYQTGSSLQTNLGNLQIFNYATDVFITASNNQLILQFGTPAFPTLGTFTVSGFNNDRFSGPGAGSYVVDDTYNFTFNYTLDPTNTFVSTSLLSTVFGTTTEITKSLSGASSTTFFVNTTNPNINYFHSGSHTFEAGLCVQLADGSLYSTKRTLSSGTTTLTKDNPTTPGISFNYSGLTGGTSFVTNTGNYSTSDIEEGVTGTITFTSSSGTADGWSSNGVFTTSNSTPITVTAAGAITTVTVSQSWDSGGLGTPLTPLAGNRTQSKAFSRIISLRYGASDSGSFTEAQLQDILAWETGTGVQNGNIDFGNTNPNGDTISVTVTTSPKFIYIIYANSQPDLTQIVQNQQNIINSFTKTVVGNYKVYKGPEITLLPTTFTATLST
jgi:hypothetical protein